jgi:small-conductance mechanosensitive channel
MDQIAAWLDQHHVSLTTVVVTLAVLIGASIALAKLNRLLRGWAGYLEARLHLPYETVMTFTRAITAVLWLIVGIIVLDIWGVGVGGIWTVLVSAATVIGVGFLATWTMVSNVTASFFMTLWRPFRHGDTVELLPENLRGRMVDRNLMFTVLREDSGSVIQVPNNLFFQKMFRVTDGDERSLFERRESRPGAAPRMREQLGTAMR